MWVALFLVAFWYRYKKKPRQASITEWTSAPSIFSAGLARVWGLARKLMTRNKKSEVVFVDPLEDPETLLRFVERLEALESEVYLDQVPGQALLLEEELLMEEKEQKGARKQRAPASFPGSQLATPAAATG
jgi:hypothetical protein